MSCAYFPDDAVCDHMVCNMAQRVNSPLRVVDIDSPPEPETVWRLTLHTALGSASFDCNNDNAVFGTVQKLLQNPATTMLTVERVPVMAGVAK